MNPTDRKSLIVFPILVVVGILVALAGGQNGSTFAGMPVFALAVGLAFIIQWIAFIPAFAQQTEKFFDITGSLTYISVTALALFLSPGADARALLLFALFGVALVVANRIGV